MCLMTQGFVVTMISRVTFPSLVLESILYYVLVTFMVYVGCCNIGFHMLEDSIIYHVI